MGGLELLLDRQLIAGGGRGGGGGGGAELLPSQNNFRVGVFCSILLSLSSGLVEFRACDLDPLRGHTQ
jgi:hypothetical protein